MQERGLKSSNSYMAYSTECVAPYAGAWIEIFGIFVNRVIFIVAPYAGAWIEIDKLCVNTQLR